MNITYDEVKNNPKLLRAMTSLDRTEFEALLVPFGVAWEEHARKTALPEQDRRREPGGGRKPALKTIADKLLFTLYYFKTYPLQEIIGFEFGMGQAQACTWIHTLSALLKQALAALRQLPERTPHKLALSLTKSGEAKFIIDGTERKIQRPKDAAEQTRYYSGKKHTHTVKNDLIVTLKNRAVKYLSQTYEGKKNDKKICVKNNRLSLRAARSTKTRAFKGMLPWGSRRSNPRRSHVVENCRPKTNNAIVASPKCVSWSSM
jgi:hypothetical protein